MNDKDNLVNGVYPGNGVGGYGMPPYMMYNPSMSPQTNFGLGMNPSITSPGIPMGMNYPQPSPQAMYAPNGQRFQSKPMLGYNSNPVGNNGTNVLNSVLNEGRSPVSGGLSQGGPGVGTMHPSLGGGHQPMRMAMLSGPMRGQPLVTGSHIGTKQFVRPSFREDAEQWTHLDISGQRLRSLSPQLFQYSFLTTLHLSHNSLSYLPPEICNLKALTKLDLSSNNINSLPIELGLLINLKELLLYDNSIVQLPGALGTLYRLETLGLEGNPINEAIKQKLMKEGCPAVIAFLRDNCEEGEEPPPRAWEDNDKGSKDDCERVKIMSYNVLSDKYATPGQYGYTPSWALEWRYRKDKLLAEMLAHNPDIICLQEIEAGQFEDFFKPQLSRAEYEGVYWTKSRAKRMSEKDKLTCDGCATFYKPAKFQLSDQSLLEFGAVVDRVEFRKTADTLNRLMNRDNVAGTVMLDRKDSSGQVKQNSKLVVANAHIHWDPEFSDVKLVQSAMLCKHVEKWIDPSQKKCQAKIPVIICGDFNSLPDSAVNQFMDSGEIAPDHPELKGRDYGDFTKNGLAHKLLLKSACQMEFTNFTPTFTATIDYIWYTPLSLTVTHSLGNVDRNYISQQVGFPNVHFPSDHIPLVIEVKIKPKAKPNQVPNFNAFNMNSQKQGSNQGLNITTLTGSGPSTHTFNQKKSSNNGRK